MFMVKRYEKNNKINRKYCEKPIFKKISACLFPLFSKKTNKKKPKTKQKQQPEKKTQRNCKTVLKKLLHAQTLQSSIFMSQ